MARPPRLRTLLASLVSALCVVTCATAAAATATLAPTGTRPGDGRPTHPRTIAAALETRAVFDDEAGGDADADDAAIWVAPRERTHSLVLGTLKNGGLDAYDLRGRLVQHVDAPVAPADGLEASRFNNVDLALGVRLGGARTDLAVVSDRGRDRLRFYAIDDDGARRGAALRDVTDATAPRLFSPDEASVEEQNTGYGLTVRPDPAGGLPYVVVSQRNRTTVGLFRVVVTSRGTVTYAPVDEVVLPSTFARDEGGSWTPCGEPGEGPQVEGMVVDTEADILYAAQEDVGVWRVPLGAEALGRPTLVERVREFGAPSTYDPQTEECTVTGTSASGGRHLSADAEGLTIAYGSGGRRTLVASSQGGSTFTTFRIDRGWAAERTFAISDSTATDGVQHSDGAAVVTTPLGRAFPRGLLVVHDGEATPYETGADGEQRVSTNFKLVDAGALHRR
ncbi:phytase [Mumia sp. ZJ1417]|uniref:phytase n=1 Tax=Mumia sp. ZJ1417 TaxID=2708082 RepID=UPI001AB03A06|nr:phytase [Mumia sp. ZJ1417]